MDDTVKGVYYNGKELVVTGNLTRWELEKSFEFVVDVDEVGDECEIDGDYTIFYNLFIYTQTFVRLNPDLQLTILVNHTLYTKCPF